MDFGRPDNARTINRLKVLTALRNNSDMSCAELSRLLLINKVSIGEIVKKLMAEGLVEETGRIETTSGRPAHRIDIAWSGASVLALEDRGKSITLAQCNLKGKTIRLECFPKGATPEDTKENFLSSLMRICRMSSTAVCGAVIASEDDWAWMKETVPFPVAVRDPMLCRVTAENSRTGGALWNTLFLHLGDHVSAAFYEGETRLLPDLRHLKVTNGRTCSCGRTGCLDTCWSMHSLREDYGEVDDRNPLSDPVIKARMKGNIDALAFAIAESMKVLSTDKAMLMGPLSALPAEFYEEINRKVKSLLPEERGSVVYKSVAGQSSVLYGAAITALDEFFFRTPLLLRLSELEAL